MHVSLCDKYTGLKIEKENLSNNACRIKRGTKLLRIKCSLSRTLVSFLLLRLFLTSRATFVHVYGRCTHNTLRRLVLRCVMYHTHTHTHTHTDTDTTHTTYTHTQYIYICMHARKHNTHNIHAHAMHIYARTRADTCMYTFVYLNFLSKV
jgi:hypothetical protein